MARRDEVGADVNSNLQTGNRPLPPLSRVSGFSIVAWETPAAGCRLNRRTYVCERLPASAVNPIATLAVDHLSRNARDAPFLVSKANAAGWRMVASLASLIDRAPIWPSEARNSRI
jgi:hypothetical protein